MSWNAAVKLSCHHLTDLQQSLGFIFSLTGFHRVTHSCSLPHLNSVRFSETRAVESVSAEQENIQGSSSCWSTFVWCVSKKCRAEQDVKKLLQHLTSLYWLTNPNTSSWSARSLSVDKFSLLTFRSCWNWRILSHIWIKSCFGIM